MLLGLNLEVRLHEITERPADLSIAGSGRFRDNDVPGQRGHDHRDLPSIVDVLRVFRYEIAFFELDRNKNVERCRQREEQMSHSHDRRTPEHGDPANVEWMTDYAIKQWSLKLERRLRPSLQMKPNLAQTEQVKVVDHNGREQHEHPTQAVGSVE